MDESLTKMQDDAGLSLVNLPAELLVEILSYLPTRDIIKAGCVSRRFKEVSETRLLWKKFVWREYEPRHVHIINDLLKAHGKHVTHLSLARRIPLSMDDIVMTHLQQLDVYTTSICIDPDELDHEVIERLTSVKKLTLRIDQFSVLDVLTVLRVLENEGHALPSIINLFIREDYLESSSEWLQCYTPRYTQASFDIYLYDIRRVPMDIYPSIPLRRFRFGPAAAAQVTKLSNHGIVGLEHDMFYLSDYNHYGKVRYSITPKYDALYEQNLECLYLIGYLYSVSNVDFSGARNICSSHLEQLAIACPNLHRLNLMYHFGCLQSLQGLRAIVDTCENLQGLNLVGIPASQMESCLLLWEILSNAKKLTHLAIGLCVLTRSSNCDDADKQKLIGMLRGCGNLKALEIMQLYCVECSNAPNIDDLLFSHFPSLSFVRLLLQAVCTDGLKYAVTNCRRLKYLYYGVDPDEVVHVTFPSSSSCSLQQLCIESWYVDISAPSMQVLSTHGELEKVVLFVKSISTRAITTLIGNSPNLILLYIVTEEPMCAEDDASVNCELEDYMDTVSKTFPCHKLLLAGEFKIRLKHFFSSPLLNYKTVKAHTDLNSLWSSIFLLGS